MKILILSRGIPSINDPQEGCFELDQAKALRDAGHEVVVMAVDSRVRRFWRKPGIEKKIIDGITTYKLFTFPTSIIRHLFSFSLGIKIEVIEAKLLYKHVIKENGYFHVIHAHFLTSIYYATKIKEKYGIPVIGTEHWSKVDNDVDSKDVQYMGKRTYVNVDKLISVSDSLRKKILYSFNVNSVIIHNLIDTSFLPISINKPNRDSFSIVLVGSLIHRKGFDYFIESFSKSRLAKENVMVTIIGGGPEFNNLFKQITNLGLTDKIKLIGQQSKKVIFEKLNSANFFVLPSRSENFSVSVLEALANGLPVVATICGGIKECINDSNGILVEVDNQNQMIKALEEMYDNYRIYDRMKIRTNCLSLYSPESIAQQINKVYESVITQVNV